MKSNGESNNNSGHGRFSNVSNDAGGMPGQLESSEKGKEKRQIVYKMEEDDD